MSENFGKKSLRRSRDKRILTGVCGGIGAFVGVDANLVRLAFAVFTLLGASGILLYIIAWLVMPEEGKDTSVLEHIIRNFQGKQSNL
ncbi:PspC domain-containing protein [Nocardiopsis gilva YIM 90087]|uniref:PspC domain-containing protein n=1 Tax=Nocardiopsis gilva YIM 90087 TaxID=1235441 RepID=A0A223SCX2_9ACTN|nr:PspC domain-containing protein [Nocardiopsis gilva]ASU85935.1 PspC domain-containing protein [Nocardiopsis gilva YIM 90087]